MSDDPKMPSFPEMAGNEPISDDDRNRILAAAWAQSYGSAVACQQLCREHVLGEINLFSEAAAAQPAAPASAPVSSGSAAATIASTGTVASGGATVAGAAGHGGEPA